MHLQLPWLLLVWLSLLQELGGRKMAQEGKGTLKEKRVIFTRKKGLCEWQARLAKWASQNIQPRYESPKNLTSQWKTLERQAKY